MRIINRKTIAAALIEFSGLMVSGVTPVYAHSGKESECICDVKCTEDNKNDECAVCMEDIALCQGEEAAEPEKKTEKMGPLTPSGNMTLVDDYGSHEKNGKQFITVTSKNGNYFYIIIDRDDNGNESVHFLNMVDEADLLNLMDDEEQKKYIKEEEPTEEPEEEPTEEPTEEPEEPVKEKKEPNVGVLALMIAAVSGGIFFYLYKKTNGKKPSAGSEDPDMDYFENDGEDYLSTLDEGSNSAEGTDEN
ncbi:protein of unknown function [Lachnospiraceae bacterium KH1T2]|nr:protein of unknown function [Lachnospiraceae bacterium KH1T2]